MQLGKKDSILLKTITKSEVLSLFTDFIDPTSPRRSKLSVHMRPKKPALKRFSLAAAQGFLNLLRLRGVPVDEGQYLENSGREPPLDEMKAHWTDILLGPIRTAKSDERQLDEANAQTLLDEFEKLAEQYPAVGDEKVELSPSVDFLTDPEVFKSKLRLSSPVKPVEDFRDDLPVLQ